MVIILVAYPMLFAGGETACSKRSRFILIVHFAQQILRKLLVTVWTNDVERCDYIQNVIITITDYLSKYCNDYNNYYDY